VNLLTWHARAFSFSDSASTPVSCSRKVKVATSTEAELETPPPRGTLPTMAASKAGRGEGKWCSTPLT